MTSTLALLLRRDSDPDAILDDPAAAARHLGPLVGLSTFALAAWALAQAALLSGLPALPGLPGAAEASGAELALATFAAGAAGLFGAQLAGLPTFYFYTLLAGLPTHGWRVSVESMRAQATAGLVLLGVLPVWVAAAEGLRLLAGTAPSDAQLVAACVWLFGGALPFITGIFAPFTLLRAMKRLALRQVRGDGRRAPLPTLLVTAWSLCFTAMAPLGLIRTLDLLLGRG
jgi:hypothetical protein